MLRKKDKKLIRHLYKSGADFLPKFDLYYDKVARTPRKGGRPRRRRVAEPLHRTWTVGGRAPCEQDRDELVKLWEELLKETRDAPDAEPLLRGRRPRRHVPAALLPTPYHRTKAGRIEGGFPAATKAGSRRSGEPLAGMRLATDVTVLLSRFEMLIRLAREAEDIKQERGPKSREYLDAERAVAEIQAEVSDVASPILGPRIVQQQAAEAGSPGPEPSIEQPPHEAGGIPSPGEPCREPAGEGARAVSTPAGELDAQEAGPLGRATDVTDRSLEDFLAEDRRLRAAGDTLKAAAWAEKWVRDLFQRRLFFDPTRSDLLTDLIWISDWVRSQRARGVRFVTRRCRDEACRALVPMLREEVQAFCSHGCEKGHYRRSR